MSSLLTFKQPTDPLSRPRRSAWRLLGPFYRSIEPCVSFETDAASTPGKNLIHSDFALSSCRAVDKKVCQGR